MTVNSVNYNKNIGSNIRFERQKRDLTIEELSEILNIAPGFLGLIERGQRGTSIKNLCRISEFFSITLDQLITKPGGTVIDPDDTEVAESTIVKCKDKHNTAVSLIHGLEESELDFIITTIKNLRKFAKTNGHVKMDGELDAE